MSESVLSMFSFRSFIVSGLTFRSLIHFEFILCMALEGVLVSFFYKWLTSFPSTIVIYLICSINSVYMLIPISQSSPTFFCGVYVFDPYVSMCLYSCFWKESESVSCSAVVDSLRPHELQPARLLCPWSSPGKNTGVGSQSLF